jgi:DNA-binding CsgD family transcriptional regulator
MRDLEPRDRGGGMSFSDRQINNLFEIAKIVYASPEPSELCTQLAMRVCPEGELAKVYLAKLDQDGYFRTMATFGYAKESRIHEYQVGLVRSVPLSDAYLRAEVIVFNKDELGTKYPKFKTVDERSPWESIAITPTLGRGLVFVFRLQVQLLKDNSTQLYFEAIASILSFYRKECNQTSFEQNTAPRLGVSAKPVNQDGLRDRPLTKRQRTILALIQEGLTNSQIANAIGYSESLVRQETILIYAKLDVRGRVDLRAESTVERVSR